jgi:hypothetical protein
MTEIAAWIAISIFLLMALFQFLLALGAPIGKMAWGGNYKILPKKLRIASFISAGIFLFAIIIILESAELFIIFNQPTIVNIFNWILVCIFGLSTLGNIMSKSRLEKIVMTPVALVLTTLCFIIAIAI